jgi:hypothetical protein
MSSSVSSTPKTGRHDIAEILLKVALSIKIQIQIPVACRRTHVLFEYPERTTDPGQPTGILYHLRLLVECTLYCNLQRWA